jgi:hypothetical protein
MHVPVVGIVVVADGQHTVAARTGPGVKLEAVVMSCRSFCVGGTFPHSLVESYCCCELIRGGPISTWAISCVNAPVVLWSMWDYSPDAGVLTPLLCSAYDREPAKKVQRLVSRHCSEVRRLVNTNRRIVTLWHRGEGPALLRRLLHGAVDLTALSPFASASQRAYLERMFTQHRRRGSPRLQATLDRYGSVLLRLLETPLAAQVASAAPEVYA